MNDSNFLKYEKAGFEEIVEKPLNKIMVGKFLSAR